jgi:hypothetical protein
MSERFSLQIKRSSTDEWYTPAEAVELIVPYLKAMGYRKILCPFDKEQSEFVRVLTARGFVVTYGHIETGQDFFDLDNFVEYDAVVSNPPFSKRTEIFERLFDSGVPFAMIMNMNGLFDSKSRWRLFKDHQFELLVPRGRIHFFNEERSGGSPNFQSIYVCHGMSKKQIEFIDEVVNNEN